MCDYSLEHVKSRPAKVGDKLITRDFGRKPTDCAVAHRVAAGDCGARLTRCATRDRTVTLAAVEARSRSRDFPKR